MSADNNKKIVNCCPHDVSVFSGSIYDPKTSKSRGGKEILHLPRSGFVASARSSVEVMPDMQMNGVSIPTCKRTFASVNDLPGENSMYIVSSVYAQAAKELGRDVSNLLTPYGTVINDEGSVIGCTGLIRYA